MWDPNQGSAYYPAPPTEGSYPLPPTSYFPPPGFDYSAPPPDPYAYHAQQQQTGYSPDPYYAQSMAPSSAPSYYPPHDQSYNAFQPDNSATPYHSDPYYSSYGAVDFSSPTPFDSMMSAQAPMSFDYLPPSLQNYQLELENKQKYHQGTITEDGESVQQSSCRGRKKAVLIGINYFNTSAALRGCINDVKNMKEFLINNYFFPSGSMLIMTDDLKDALLIPTRQNILNAMKWLVKDAAAGDSLFFHFSGHGGTVKDTNGDEDDGFDETIFPSDYQKSGVIVDDEMHEIMVRHLPAGVRLTALFDCCHSGTPLDLPYSYKVDGSLEIQKVDNRISGTVGVFKLSTGIHHLMHHLAHHHGGKKKKGDTSRGLTVKQVVADVLQLGGCRDNQTSADASLNGTATGAMTFAFIKALNNNKNQSLAQLLKTIRKIVSENRFSQIPMLSSGYALDINNTPFII
eukprot:TRINITY_DN58_c1_g1_i1.p1 TRINITY_DN58_c1_g1~~TRINITY_DN58_c1_g1_i1.p1  ORF type:complete len:457 (-),score=114.01 TRINITY_DN58_c1_g1_i1:140-1510(-)